MPGANLCQVLDSKRRQSGRSGLGAVTGHFSLFEDGSSSPPPGCSECPSLQDPEWGPSTLLQAALPPARGASAAPSSKLLFQALVAMGTAARASVARNSRSSDSANGQQAP